MIQVLVFVLAAQPHAVVDREPPNHRGSGPTIALGASLMVGALLASTQLTDFGFGRAPTRTRCDAFGIFCTSASSDFTQAQLVVSAVGAGIALAGVIWLITEVIVHRVSSPAHTASSPRPLFSPVVRF